MSVWKGQIKCYGFHSIVSILPSWTGLGNLDRENHNITFFSQVLWLSWWMAVGILKKLLLFASMNKQFGVIHRLLLSSWKLQKWWEKCAIRMVLSSFQCIYLFLPSFSSVVVLALKIGSLWWLQSVVQTWPKSGAEGGLSLTQLNISYVVFV